MDGSASIGLEQALLGHSLGFAPFASPTQVYVSLCLASTVPSETVPGLEASGGGYTRMPATFALIAGPSNIAANTASIEFPQALSSWGQIGFFELWDAPSGGNRLYWGQLVSTADFTTPLVLQVSAGDITRFSAGTLGVQAATGSGGTASIGAYLPLAGGQLSGPLLLAGDPTGLSEAATKSYVDAHSGSGGGPGFLPLSGGTVFGATTFSASITSPLFILTPTVNFQWVSPQIVASQPFASSQIVAGRGLSIAPATAAISPAFNGNVSIAGTVTGQSDIYRFTVSADNAAGAAGMADGLIKTVGIYSNINGAAVNRGRAGLWVNQQVLTGPTVAGLEMIGGSFTVFCSNTNAAYSPLCQPLCSAGGVAAGANAGDFLNEFDYYAAAGSTVGTKGGLLISLSNGDKVRGAVADAGLFFSNANSFAAASPGMRFALALGNTDQGFPVSTADGTIFGVMRQVGISGTGRSAQMIPTQTLNGFDLNPIYFTGNAFMSPGFSVDGAGQVRSGNALIAQTATGISFDVDRQVVTAVGVVVGGIGTGTGTDNYYVGDTVDDGIGGVYTVSTVSAGKITALTIRAAATSASPPANPIALRGGSGSGATVNLTWTARTALSLQPSGGALGFYGATPVAKQTGVAITVAAVHAALTALGLIAP